MGTVSVLYPNTSGDIINSTAAAKLVHSSHTSGRYNAQMDTKMMAPPNRYSTHAAVGIVDAELNINGAENRYIPKKRLTQSCHR